MVREPPVLSGLPRAARAAVAAARALAGRRGERLYLAGGAVRDLLSARTVRDVDLVVEERASGFAQELAERLEASRQSHDRFGTAVLTLPDGSRVDVASARSETYAAPGALPSVSLAASIAEDLARRDFTIHAMALEIAPGRRLIDPFGGREDLARGVVRALHPGSFLDDPTRAFRAVRYAHRLRFRIAADTRRAIAAAVSARAFDRVSGDRLRRELVKILSEPERAGAVRSIRRLGLDAAIDRAMARSAVANARLTAAEELARGRPGVSWLCYFLVWMGMLRPADARRIAARLRLTGEDHARWSRWHEDRRRLGPGLRRLKRSEIARRTKGRSFDEILAAAASLHSADREALLSIEESRARIRLRISGSDLLAAGIPSGAAIGRALARTLAARFDGAIGSEDELDYAIRAARRGARRR